MKKIVFLSVAALAFLCLVAGPAGAVPMLSFSPSSQTVAVGDSVNVDLVISDLGLFGAPSLSTFDLDVMYDPAVLGLDTTDADMDGLIDSVVFGDQLDIWGLGSIQSVTPGVGSVNLSELSLDFPADLDDNQLDTFTLATLTFDTLAVGTSPLDIFVYKLGDGLGDPLEYTTVSGSISPAPEPATLFLLGSGLVGLMGFHRKRRRA